MVKVRIETLSFSWKNYRYKEVRSRRQPESYIIQRITQNLGGLKILLKLETYIRQKQKDEIAKVINFIFYNTDQSCSNGSQIPHLIQDSSQVGIQEYRKSSMTYTLLVAKFVPLSNINFIPPTLCPLLTTILLYVFYKFDFLSFHI